MPPVSKKYLPLAVALVASALMALGATLTALDGSGLEEAGFYTMTAGGILAMVAGIAIPLQRNGQQCSRKDVAVE